MNFSDEAIKKAEDLEFTVELTLPHMQYSKVSIAPHSDPEVTLAKLWKISQTLSASNLPTNLLSQYPNEAALKQRLEKSNECVNLAAKALPEFKEFLTAYQQGKISTDNPNKILGDGWKDFKTDTTKQAKKAKQLEEEKQEELKSKSKQC